MLCRVWEAAVCLYDFLDCKLLHAGMDVNVSAYAKRQRICQHNINQSSAKFGGCITALQGFMGLEQCSADAIYFGAVHLTCVVLKCWLIWVQVFKIYRTLGKWGDTLHPFQRRVQCSAEV